LLVASQPPTVSVRWASCCIKGRIGVSEKRPMPMALARANSPIEAAAAADVSGFFPLMPLE
jgi:hypothetical protein